MGVYQFIQDLIVEGTDAWFVKDKEPGRIAINWLKATERYASDYKPRNKSRNPSNNLRSALLHKRYKDDGAKEYKESQKKDEGGNIVERQFQLPANIFKSLFGSNDGRQEETGGTSSKACKSSQETANASTSDTSGYEDTIDTSCDDTDSRSEEESDISTPFQMFGIPKEELKKLSYDYQGVVEGIFPKAGSTEGGLLFIITFKEKLQENDTSEMYEAEFDGVGVVPLEKFENSALSGFTPPSLKTGPVNVTVRTQAGRLLLITSFQYVDCSTLDVLKQLVKDPALQSLLYAEWSQEQIISGSNSVIAHNQGPSTMQDQGSSVQSKHAQALKVLQLLALTAGQTNARQFIQMLFRTSVGKTMPNTNKVPTPLLKDVAMASGHDDVAQNLQDVNTRLTKEGSSEVPVTAANEIQKQSSVTDDETSLESGQCKRDDNQADYFADIETSSSGSFELEAGGSGSDDDDGTCTNDGGCKKELSGKSTSSLDGASLNTPFAELDDGSVKSDETCKEPPALNSEDNTTAREESVIRVMGTRGCVDIASVRQQDSNACPSHEETARRKNSQESLNFGEQNDVRVYGQQYHKTLITSKTLGNPAVVKVKRRQADIFSRNVALLKKNDCMRRMNGKVCIPTTIEMTKIKRPETGQYKRNVQFSKKMSEEMVRQKLQDTFTTSTFNLNGRFFCATITHDRMALEFHGTPRIWDGNTIRRYLRCNSMLFIVMEDDEFSNYSDASTTGISTTPPPVMMVMTPSDMPKHARFPIILSTTEYPGDWNFQISFDPLSESASKSATWTYSDVCKKLYVNLASYCPIKFKTSTPPPPGTYLRAMAVFKDSFSFSDIVERCLNHMESSSDGSAPKNHFIRSNNPAAHYHTCPESARQSVLLPYNGPQVGTEHVTEMFAFMCSGPSGRPVEVIFTLERDGQTLGRRVVEIRVCACPGCDRMLNEKMACYQVGLSKEGSSSGPASKRRRISWTSQEEVKMFYKTKLAEVYEPLMQPLMDLGDVEERKRKKFKSLNFLKPDNMPGDLFCRVKSTSEDEAAEKPSRPGSPGTVFKRAGLSSM